MRYDAVIFDLFGTMIDQGRREDSAAYYDRLAAALGMAIDDLTGALAVGMHPVLIRVACEDWFFKSHPEANEWTGPVISHLSEVLELAGLP